MIVVGVGAGVGVDVGVEAGEGIGATETDDGVTDADPPLPPPQAVKLTAVNRTRNKLVTFIKRSAQ